MEGKWIYIAFAILAISIVSCSEGDDIAKVPKMADQPTGFFWMHGDEDERQPDLRYNPVVIPMLFVDEVTNPYFPLMPGTVYTYEAETEDETETIVVTVTHEKKKILGVWCTVVHDVVSVDGEVVEDTYDWYAQDIRGNVWYMGEDSKELEDGEVVSTEGSWEAGVDGAKPGIIMFGRLRLNVPYRQEYYFDVAEDWGKVIAIGVTVEIGLGVYENCVQTADWNALEPGVLEHKFYAPGIGVIKEETVKGDEEVVELVEIN